MDDDLEPLSIRDYARSAPHLDIDTDGLTEDEIRAEIEIQECSLDLTEEAETWLGIVADLDSL